MAKRDEQAGHVKEGFIHLWVAFVADHQPAKISQPGKGAFDFPTASITPEFAPILRGFFLSPFAMGTNQLDALLFQMRPQFVAVVSTVGNQSLDFATQLFGQRTE